MEYEFSVSEIEHSIYAIKVNREFDLLLNTLDDPYLVYYGGSQAFELLTKDSDFEKKLFDYLKSYNMELRMDKK